MKNNTLLVFFICTILNSENLFSQVDVHNTKGYLCTVLDLRSFQFNDITVYEDAINSTLEEKLTKNRDKRYYYIPAFAIDKSSFEIKNLNAKQSSIYAEIKPQPVELNELRNFIKYQQNNPDVQEGNILPLCSFGYELVFRNQILDEGTTSLGTSMSKTILIDKEIPIAQATQLKEHLQSGKAIKIYCYVDTKLSCLLSIDQSINRIKSSATYRDFISPSIGNKITINQKMNLINKLDVEIKKNINVDRCVDITNEQLFSYFNTIFFKETNIIYDCENSKDYLFNLGSERLSSDEVNELAIKSQSENQDDWSKAYEKIKENHNINKRSSSGEGGGGFDVIKIFKIDGNGKITSTGEIETESKNSLKDSKTAKKLFSQLFDGKWAGKKFTPRGIFDYEIIDLSDSNNIRDYLLQSFRDHETRKIEILIKLN